jgi:hypothetical protein
VAWSGDGVDGWWVVDGDCSTVDSMESRELMEASSTMMSGCDGEFSEMFSGWGYSIDSELKEFDWDDWGWVKSILENSSGRNRIGTGSAFRAESREEESWPSVSWCATWNGVLFPLDAEELSSSGRMVDRGINSGIQSSSSLSCDSIDVGDR